MKLSTSALTSFLLSTWLLPSANATFDCATLSCVPEPGFGLGSGFATYRYGDSRTTETTPYYNQEADVYLPASPLANPIPVVVLIHGGYWYDQYRRKTTNGSDMRPLALDLQARGYAVVNLEYRRAATYFDDAGRVPGTFNDVGDGVDVLSCVTELPSQCSFPGGYTLNPDKVAVVGHSAGGQLALWRALQHGIDPSNPYGIDSSPVVNPIGAVGLAAVSDMYNGCAQGTASCSAIANFLQVSTYAQLAAVSDFTSPIEMAAVGNVTEDVAFYLAHGSSDPTVLPQQSLDFVGDITAPGAKPNLSAEPDPFASFSGEGHFDVIDPSKNSWTNGVVPFLDTVLNTPGCSVNADCDDGLFCNGAETCNAGVCEAGVPPNCADSVGCTVDTCNEVTDMCDNTPDNSQCDNGLFCDGAEVCNAVTGCEPGTPVDCNDSVGCTVDTCNEVTDMCDNTPDNSQCDNGLFCDGEEVCNAVTGCEAGTPVDCDDGVGCTDDSCDESADSCVNVANNSACDDGLFCNGVETCDEANDCQSGASACPGQVCDEDNDVCANCFNDADCDDGIFCNGAETCVSGTCQGGTPPSCDDGVGCTTDTCNTSADSCENTPVDALCDNGTFCDGEEVCNASTGCEPGTPVDCDDGLSCTSDSCDEANEVCVNTPDDLVCDDNLFCNGAETCDPAASSPGTGCVAGTPIDCNDGVGCTIDSCNETADSCDNIADDSACDDGLSCNGLETCDTTNDCLSGTPVTCQSGETCTEPAGVCAAESDLVLSEVFPNPNGSVSDRNGEFVEIYNPSSSPISLTDYSLKEEDTRNPPRIRITDLSGTVAPFDYYVVCRNSGYSGYAGLCDEQANRMALRNQGETITLLKNDVEIDSFSYTSAPGGLSWSLQGDGSWIAVTPSIGQANNS